MSRIGKLPVIIPKEVQVDFDSKTRFFSVKGPLGKNQILVHPKVLISLTENKVAVNVNSISNKQERSLWGTYRSLIQNLVTGVSTAFVKQVELNGVGYKMELKDKLVLFIGYSHPIEITIPEGISLDLKKNLLSGKSVDKQQIGDFFTKIHNLKPCDPYKQKGFKFPGKFYTKKEGKKSK